MKAMNFHTQKTLHDQRIRNTSTFSEKGDQECPGHDFLMSRYAVCYVSSKSKA